MCTQYTAACMAERCLLNYVSYISVYLRPFFRLSPYIRYARARLYRDMTEDISLTIATYYKIS